MTPQLIIARKIVVQSSILGYEILVNLAMNLRRVVKYAEIDQ